jgi:hypothetical protein
MEVSEECLATSGPIPILPNDNNNKVAESGVLPWKWKRAGCWVGRWGRNIGSRGRELKMEFSFPSLLPKSTQQLLLFDSINNLHVEMPLAIKHQHQHQRQCYSTNPDPLTITDADLLLKQELRLRLFYGASPSSPPLKPRPLSVVRVSLIASRVDSTSPFPHAHHGL